ncbi:MAG: PaaI family thioesterase [Candidatus Hydrogenedentes bacterium]|nr:PaaI family thioesterase [Candidatus Hydrogenedentota bacterium]
MDVEALNQRMLGSFAEKIGFKYLEASPEGIKASLAVRDDLCTVPGIMHGGALMAMADSLGAVGTGLNLPSGAGTTTIESKTNFFAPVRTGTTIMAECTPLHRGKSTMVWQTRFETEDGKLAALVTQTQIVLTAS